MAVGIVDGLEVVDVDDQQGAILHTPSGHCAALLLKAAPVQQPGQRIGQRQPLHQLQLAAQSFDLLELFFSCS